MLGIEMDCSGNEPRLRVKRKGVATLAGCSEWTIRTLERDGRLPEPVSHEGGVYYRYEDILEFIEKHKRFFFPRRRRVKVPTEKPWWLELGTNEAVGNNPSNPKTPGA